MKTTIDSNYYAEHHVVTFQGDLIPTALNRNPLHVVLNYFPLEHCDYMYFRRPGQVGGEIYFQIGVNPGDIVEVIGYVEDLAPDNKKEALKYRDRIEFVMSTMGFSSEDEVLQFVKEGT